MAKTRPKAKPEPEANGAKRVEAEAARLPCYALSLTIENVRCFGPKQTLKLSDLKGQPTQ
jgi:hypothetical protein